MGLTVVMANAAMIAYGARRILRTKPVSAARAPGTRAGEGSCAPARLNRSALLPGTSIAVSPLPDSRDASSATQISMLGAPSSGHLHVGVRGSRSGRHTGRLVAYSQGDGFSFLPDKAFVEGETVTVRGIADAHAFAYRFVVASKDQLPYSPPGKQSYGTHSQIDRYRSRPDLVPPSVDVTSVSPRRTRASCSRHRTRARARTAR